jgi:hypothetical protein
MKGSNMSNQGIADEIAEAVINRSDEYVDHWDSTALIESKLKEIIKFEVAKGLAQVLEDK